MNYARTRCHNEKADINALLNYGACMEKTKKINEIFNSTQPFHCVYFMHKGATAFCLRSEYVNTPLRGITIKIKPVIGNELKFGTMYQSETIRDICMETINKTN